MTTLNWWHVGFWLLYVAAGFNNYCLYRHYWLNAIPHKTATYVLAFFFSLAAWPLYGFFCFWKDRK